MRPLTASHAQIVLTLLILSCSVAHRARAADKPRRDAAARAPSLAWRKGYGTDGEEHVHEGLQTRDGGYVAIGTTESGDILVIKIHANGELQWQKTIGENNQYDAGLCIAEVPDGYILGGVLYSSGTPQAALLKLGIKGDILWQHTYRQRKYAAIRGIDITRDGGIVATGYSDHHERQVPFIADEAKGFIMKTDATGRLQWKKILSVPQGTKVREDIKNGGFIVCSTVWLNDGGDHQNACLVKTDDQGDVQWIKNYGGDGNDQCFDFDLASDGGYVLAGHTTSYGNGGWNAWLVKVDAKGDMTWHKSFGEPLGGDPKQIFDECYGVRTTPDGGFIMACGSGIEPENRKTQNDPHNTWAAYVIRTDSAGNLLWEFTYHTPGKGHNAAEYVNLCRDGGTIVFLDSDTEGKPRPNNVGFLKLAPDQ